MEPDSLVGETIDGRYQVVRLLGAGAMGCVYEAQHTGTKRRLALKVISTGDVTKNAALVGRFHREAKAAGGIDSKHITQVLDTGTDPASGNPFMVMEYLSGQDLQQFLRSVDGRLSTDLALRLAAQACVGLQKAHDARVVHRDIKPANLFLASGDRDEIVIKLLDFGIAKIKAEVDGAETHGLTRTGSMLGSPLYMSPEQARGSKNIDHRTDIWSLGIVLYQALAGQTPYEDIEALGELIIAICSIPPKHLQDTAPWVPPEVATIVHRALHYDRDARFQTAGEMLDAIKPLLPSGYAVDASMLVGITPDERARVAPRLTLDMDRQSSVPLPHMPSHYPPSMTSLPSMPPPPPSSMQADSSTAAGVAGQVVTHPPPKPKASALSIGIGAVVVLGALGIGAAKLFGGPPPAPSSEPMTMQATPPPRPDPTPAATPSVAPVPSDRMVKLVVIPPEVAVEVDGAKVETKRGVIEIFGPLGSLHKVKLTQGKNEIIEDVVVTEAGAMPPKLELSQKAIAAKANAKTSATPSVAPVAPTAPKGIEQTFE